MGKGVKIERCWHNEKGEFVCRAFVDGGKSHVEAAVATMLDEGNGRKTIEPSEVKALDGESPSAEGIDELFNWMLTHTETP